MTTSLQERSKKKNHDKTMGKKNQWKRIKENRKYLQLTKAKARGWGKKNPFFKMCQQS